MRTLVNSQDHAISPIFLFLRRRAHKVKFSCFWPKSHFFSKVKKGRKHEIRQNLGKTAKNAKIVKFAVLTTFAKSEKPEKSQKSGPFFRVWQNGNAPKSVSFLNRGSVVPWLTVGKKVLDPPKIDFEKVHCYPIEILGERRGVPFSHIILSVIILTIDFRLLGKSRFDS